MLTLDKFDVNDFSDQFFGNLNQAERRHFMEVCYKKILAYPEILVDHASPLSVKENSINVLIKYFESEEEYEKCAHLKKLIEAVSS
jgi:hypothetical protein